MDFIDQLKQFAQRVDSLRETIETEEATKTALIMPFFSMMGYDVFNPSEFVPEFTSDVGTKKGEKVDYAIIKDGQPTILIECKPVSESLEKHESQLFRYFVATNAKFAILTNGILYKFYTDLDAPNKMDKLPFLTINILNVRESQVAELKKFRKSEFDVEQIASTASDLKYLNEFKQIFLQQLESPTDEFLRVFLQQCYSGQKNQIVMDRFRPILKRAINLQISEMMNDKIKAALGGEGSVVSAEDKPVRLPETEANDSSKPDEYSPEKRLPRVNTTEEELEAYFIVKNILSEVVDMKDITYKDRESYFGILYKNNTWKWICRLRLSRTQKILILPDENKNEVKFVLNGIYDLRNYKEQIIEVLKRYIA